MIFRQLFEPQSSTYTYLVASEATREAALIDPVVEEVETYVRLLEELGLTLAYTLETHLHADHVTAAARLRERLGSRSVTHAESGAECADVKVREGDVVAIGDVRLEVREVPGHTNADVAYVAADRVFTGDALLIDGCGRTDFQHGDSGRLYDSVHAKIFSLPPETLIFPAHDYRGNTSSTVGRERETNARLGGGRTREDFVALMAQLKLAYPKQIDRALPANQACGREKDVVWELSPDGAVRRLAGLRVVDVREPDEFTGPLGHIAGATLAPLATVAEAAASWPREAPTLLVCRSGGRSGRAAAMLLAMGFREVYNLTGGMLAWNERGLPVVERGA
jgi:sulfur dioxygenase